MLTDFTVINSFNYVLKKLSIFKLKSSQKNIEKKAKNIDVKKMTPCLAFFILYELLLGRRLKSMR